MTRYMKWTLMAVLAFGLFGCENLVDDVEPTGSVSSEQALTSQAGFEALLISGYDRLQGTDRYGQQYVLYPDALADNANVTQPNSNRYANVVANTRGAHLGIWGSGYALINEMNNIVAKIDDLDIEASNAQGIKDRIKGEALFLRGLSYFDMARIYGYEPGQEVNSWDASVILRTDPTESVDDADFRARDNNSASYQRAIEDFTQAASLLAGSGNTKVRANEAAAYGLLARAQLYAGNWAAAEAAATNALNATSAVLITDTGNGNLLSEWLAPSHAESVFELQMSVGTDGASTNTNGSLDALTNARAEAPGQQAFSFEVIPTADLVAAHDAADARLNLYATGRKAGATSDVTYIRKYTGTSGANVDRVPVLRLPELLLIRAEARARQGDAAGARADLNTLRNARNLGDVDGSLSGAALTDAIMLERRLELAFEGHRFFDLKRLGMDIPKPQAGSTLAYENFRILAPLPQSQVDNNELLFQNPGY